MARKRCSFQFQLTSTRAFRLQVIPHNTYAVRRAPCTTTVWRFATPVVPVDHHARTPVPALSTQSTEYRLGMQRDVATVM